jgi:hypothetical protein
VRWVDSLQPTAVSRIVCLEARVSERGVDCPSIVQDLRDSSGMDCFGFATRDL